MRKVVGFLAIIAVAGLVACASEEAADEPMEGETMEEPQMEETTDTMPADTAMARDTAEMEEEM
ncbi:MAG: hypothetical protein PVF27_00440 [Gemmatimonadales bacterium]